MMMTGWTPEGRLRMTSNPPMRGICRSRKTRSGCRRAMSRRASLPLAASPTISTPEKAASSSRRTWRATGSSSTMSVRSGRTGIIKELTRKLAMSHGKVMSGRKSATAGSDSATGGLRPVTLLYGTRARLRGGGIVDGDREVLPDARHIGHTAGERDANAALVIRVVGRSGMAGGGDARRAFSGHAAVAWIWAVFVGPQQNRDGRPRDSQLDQQQFSLAFHISPSKHRLRAIYSIAMGVLRNYHTLYTIPAR